MWTLMIGVVLLIVGALIGGWTGVIIVVILTGILVLLPLEGYEEPEQIAEIKLLKLKKYNECGKTRYVERIKNEARFAFDNHERYNVNFEAYEEKSILGRIKVYESEECKAPVLRIFKFTPNRAVFTFAPFSKKEYVFLLPQGTLQVLNEKGERVEEIAV